MDCISDDQNCSSPASLWWLAKIAKPVNARSEVYVYVCKEFLSAILVIGELLEATLYVKVVCVCVCVCVCAVCVLEITA